MYELLNIRNKFKGNRFYYCNFLVTNYYEVQPILRKIYIRMATYVGDNIILVGQDFRIELPINHSLYNPINIPLLAHKNKKLKDLSNTIILKALT